MKKVYLLLPLMAVQFLQSQTASEPTSVSNIMDNVKQIYPAVPTANNLMKFEEVPVSNYSGIPDIKIPLITLPINNSPITMDVSLNYHPNNSKPDDKSGEAGLGWNLFAGGSITRTVRGTPDDQNVMLSPGGQPSIGIYFDEFTSDFLDKNYTRKYLDALETGTGLGSSDNQFKKLFYEALYFSRYDTEYDLYQYNFMGYSGRFIIKKDSNNQLYVEKLDKNNLRISISSVSSNNSFEANSFIITDELGNKYTFDITEKSLRTSLTNRVGFKGHVSTNASNLGNVNSAFHLSKITNMADVELAKFSYYPAQQIIYADYSQIYRSVKTPIQSYEEKFDREIPSAQETSTTSTTTLVRILKDIEIIGKGKISFTYLQGREDSNFTNPQQLLKLDKISLTDYSGKNLESYQFEYDYFVYRLLGRDVDERRLSLKKVTKYNSSSGKDFDYTLEYNQNNSGFSLGKDHWDWFNCVKPADNYLLAKEPSPACITTNLLKSIKLPSGGIRKFNFGSNTYSYVGNQPVDVYENPDNWENLNSEVTYLKTENRVRKYFFTLPSPQTVEFESLANQIANDIWSISIYKKEGNNYIYVTNLGTSVDSGYVTNQTRDLNSGEYYVVFNGDFTSNYNGTVNFIATYTDKKVSDIIPYLLGGGVRINNISYFDKLGDAIPVKKIDFDYSNVTNSQKSSGALIFPRPIHSYNYDYNNVFVYDCSSMTPCKQTFTNNFTIFSTENFLPVQKTQGADICYQNVSVSETNKGEDLFTYTSPIDKSNPEQISSVPPFTAIGNYDYKRGLLIDEETKDNNNTLLYKKSNQYTTYDSEKLSGITLRHAGSPYTEYLYAGNFKTYESYLSNCVNAIPNPSCSSNPIDMIAITNHREIIGKANANSSEEIYYLPQPLKTTKFYEYNNLDYPIKQKNTFSDGIVNEATYSYAHEKGNQ
ncbi:hypothetical protein, partial [Chryseobacterium lathyri]